MIRQKVYAAARPRLLHDSPRNRARLSTHARADENLSLTLHDGRRLAFATYGPSSGKPVILLHGSPACRLDGRYFERWLEQLNIRLIAPDRPGYGESSPQSNRTLCGYASDVSHLADSLHLESFRILGMSGGGPHALTCTLKIPKERLLATGVLYGAGPTHQTGLLGQGFSKTQVFGLWLRRAFPGIAESLTVKYHVEPIMQPGYGERVRKDLEMLKTPKEKAIWSKEEIIQIYLDSNKETFKQGVSGHSVDSALLMSHWGFKLSDIRQKESGHGPIIFWTGDKDEQTPLSQARYMLDGLSGRETWAPYVLGATPSSDALLRVFKDENHLTLLDQWGGSILEELLE
jgi:pimeloyl-ACP methyl ester carboxylesterase